jgi:hypothetical protein
MCQFKSGVVMKNGDVKWLLDADSHETILKHFNIKDDGVRDNFVRVEMIPISLPLGEAVYKLNLKTWHLKVDQDNVPDWWKATEKHAATKMLAVLKESVKKRCLLKGKSIEEIKDGQVWILVAGKVNYVHDSATINSVYGSATINSVYGSATIKDVSGSATINCVYGSATINNVSGSATINYVSGSATIKDVKNQAVILISRDNGKLKIRTALDVEVVK